MTSGLQAFHCTTLLFRLAGAFGFALLIESAEAVFGPVQQHAQVVAIHAKFAANLVFLLFFQEDRAEELAILLAELRQNPSDLLASLFGYQKPFQIYDFVHRLRGAVIF